LPELALNVLPEAILRLAARREGASFLEPHHLEAAKRLVILFERSQMRQRVTMSYDAVRTGGRGRLSGQSDLADTAADARNRLNGLASLMASDCWSLLTDLCLFEKGLQQIETERDWPRRSAKLVLRIGLDQLCTPFGLSHHANGQERGVVRTWLPERPPMFPADGN